MIGCRVASWGLFAVAATGFVGTAIAQDALEKTERADGSTDISTQPTGSAFRQSMDDAWWTGPIVTNTAATLPPGRGYIEPYLFDVRSKGRSTLSSLTFIQYGVAERLTLGVIPTAGYTRVKDGLNSSDVGLGDVTLAATYRLSNYRPGHWMPTTALSIQQSLPTGKYDRLGDRPANGFGSGAHTTTVGFFGQAYFWMPNGRILRSRINIQRGFSGHTKVEDVSVYDTSDGFRGRARPGNSFSVNNSWEYSVSRSWVLAVDFGYRHENRTRVKGADATGPVDMSFKSTDSFLVAPAVEYSWNPRHGVLFGMRYIPANGTVRESVTPVMAVSVFL